MFLVKCPFLLHLLLYPPTTTTIIILFMANASLASVTRVSHGFRNNAATVAAAAFIRTALPVAGSGRRYHRRRRDYYVHMPAIFNPRCIAAQVQNVVFVLY